MDKIHPALRLMDEATRYALQFMTPDYLDEMERLHAAPQGFGTKSYKWKDVVVDLLGGTGGIVLDWGCGSGSLVSALREDGYQARGWDPAHPDWKLNAPPLRSSLVVCTDVLEHVEPVFVDAVLRELHRLAKRRVFVVISLVETAKTLSDGRQAHICLQDRNWWRCMLTRYFNIEAEPDHAKPEKAFVAILQPRENVA